MNIIKRARKNTSAYIICAVMATVITSPILSLSLQANNINPSNSMSVESDAAVAEDSYFDSAGYALANYVREDIALGNRGSDSEELLFGSVDDESAEASTTPPADMTFYEDSTIVYLNSNGVNMRQYPSLDAAVIRQGSLAEEFTRTGVNEQWIRVAGADGVTGYIKAEFIAETKPTPTPKPTATPTPKPKTKTATIKITSPVVANTLGESIAAEAKKYIGVHYRHGCEDPNVGFDCSGLTWYVFNRYGISTPRGTDSYYNAGIVIAYSQIAPGDVIAWDTRTYDKRTSITHVAIYIGNGMMIHASSSNNAVRIASVSEYTAGGCKIISVHRFIKS